MPRIRSGGRLSVSKALEHSLSWKPGTEVTFRVVGERLVVESVSHPKNPDFIRRTEAAYREIEKGKYVETSSADFLKSVRKA